MPDATQVFDQLVTAVDSLEPKAESSGDAIDQILSSAPRTTSARSLRDDPVVARFRSDLANGVVRIETAKALFQLIGEAISRFGGI